MRRALGAAGIVLAVLGVVALLAAFRGNHAAIAAARAQAARFQEQRDSLGGVVRQREAEQAALTVRLKQHLGEAQSLRDSVTALERRRSASQLDVRRLRTVSGRTAVRPHTLLDRLRAAFPELGDSAWRLTTLPLDGDTLGLEYLMVPAWFAETFVIDRANARSWRKQKDRLLALDSLGLVVAALQDSVTRLVAANAAAYETGYRTAYAGYQDLSERYVAELGKPRFGLPSPVGMLAAALLGVVAGRAIP